MAIFVKIDQEIWEKWKRIGKEKQKSFHNTKNMSEEAHAHQIAVGHAAQEVIGKWLKSRYEKFFSVEINLEIGKDQYDTDHARGLSDVKINNKKIDIKTKKALKPEFEEDDLIIIAEYENSGIRGFNIKGYWVVEDIKNSMRKIRPPYLLPTKKLSPISKLKKEFYTNERRET